MEKIDYIGKRYGQWTIISDLDEYINHSRLILCQCDCGTLQKFKKSPFIGGHNSEKCRKCSLKELKRLKMCGWGKGRAKSW
jgi:hypothetical protein